MLRRKGPRRSANRREPAEFLRIDLFKLLTNFIEEDLRATLRMQDARKSTNRWEPAELLRPPKNSWDSTIVTTYLYYFLKVLPHKFLLSIEALLAPACSRFS